MSFGGLKCAECGADLELSVGCDGLDEQAERYDGRWDREWGWEVSLHGTKCSRVYPICRTPNYKYISKIKLGG